MAYESLTCEEKELPLEELFRRAMVDNGDGSRSIQVVWITDGGGDFNDDFSDDFSI